MEYHIDTGLIKEKFAESSECPLCEIKKIVEEQFLHEFLNDAVMDDSTRIKVGKLGFCSRHFDMLFSRQNKLSVALQICTRIDNTKDNFSKINSVRSGLKQAEAIKKASHTCVICELINESMIKYYKTIAEMFLKERDFYTTILKSKGFCLEHYAELLTYAKYAGFVSKEYVSLLSDVQQTNMERIRADLQKFCDKHDYRNALEPMGTADTALPRTRTKLYGKKYD